MKKTLTLLMVLCVVFSAFASPIQQATAKKIAESFLNQKTINFVNGKQAVSRENKPIQLVYTATNTITPQRPLFYVFNKSNNGGFIIVSADTRVKQILGYSDSGTFDSKNIPDNMRYWLDMYQREITYAVNNLPDVKRVSRPQRAARAITAVEPLLKIITYNQNTPYNDLCPEIGGQKAPTGCVATAIAQIMKFYEWPKKGTGQHSYTSRIHNLNLSVNFEEAEYDWTKIKSSYDADATDAEKEEIAKLMYHVGVASNMNYALRGSGANTGRAVVALTEYFSYAKTADRFQRKNYSIAAWENIIKTELETGRPVLYSGGNADGAGHAFVCDGFNEENLFHINWGWGGLSNGYFELSALTPSQQGIGSNNGGYNFGQEIYVGLQPLDNENSQKVPIKVGVEQLNVSKQVANINESVTFTAINVSNAGLFTMERLNTCLVLEKGNGEFIELSRLNWETNLGLNNYFNSMIYNVNIDNTIEKGIYTARLYYRNEEGKDVPAIAKYDAPTSFKVEVTETQVFFTAITPNIELSLTGNPIVQKKIYTGKTTDFDIPLRNAGEHDYSAQIGIKLVKKDDSSVSLNINNSYVVIPAGSDKTISLGGKVSLPVGEYKVVVYYDSKNKQSDTDFPQDELTSFDENYTVMVKVPTPGKPILTIKNVTYPKEVKVGQEMRITFTMTNTGGYAEAEIIPFSSFEDNWLMIASSKSVALDKNESATIEFVRPTVNFKIGKYTFDLYNLTAQEWLTTANFAFDVVDVPSEILINNAKATELVVVPSSVGDILNISLPEDAQRMFIYDTQGRVMQQINVEGKSILQTEISSFNQGMYIVRVIGKGVNYISKFLKR